MSLLTGEPRRATVRAVDGALVYEIGREQYAPLLLAHREWVDELATVMETRLREREALLASTTRIRAGTSSLRSSGGTSSAPTGRERRQTERPWTMPPVVSGRIASTSPAPGCRRRSLTYLRGRHWRLEASYTYHDGPTAITVPAGFRFDLSSVPARSGP